MSYTKLSASLTASSIWNESDRTRIVWITMLSMADRNGDVKGSIIGLAHLARVTLEDAQDALRVLEAPDIHSTQKESQGRRVIAFQGGWHLVTHQLYREEGVSDEETKAAWRERQRKHRERSNLSNPDVTDVTMSRVTDRDLGMGMGMDVQEKKSEEKKRIEEIYKAYPRHEAKPDALRAIEKACHRESSDLILQRTIAYAKTRPAHSQFTPLPATWFNAQRYNDDPAEWERKADTQPQDRKRRKDEIQQKLNKQFASIKQSGRVFTEKEKEERQQLYKEMEAL